MRWLMRCTGVNLSDSLLGGRLTQWTALMLILEALFVPRGLSAGTFTMLALTGPVVLLSGSNLRKAWRLQPGRPRS